MFVVKSLFGKIMGNETNPELVQLQSGQLYLVRPNSVKGSRECIYKDAVATIRRTTEEFNYQLVITRAYEEGEEELLEEDEETDDERVFLIDPELHFHSAEHEGAPSFRWDDISGDEGDTWEFVVDSQFVNAATRGLFETTMLTCMYERVRRRSSQNATEEELEQFRFGDAPPTFKSKGKAPLRAPPPADTSRLRTPTTVQSEDPAVAELSSALGKTTIQEPAAGADDEDEVDGLLNEGEGENPLPAPEDPAQGNTIFQARAGLYLFDRQAETFMVQAEEADVSIVEVGKFLFWLVVKHAGQDGLWLSQPVDSSMNSKNDPDSHSFMWNYYSNSHVHTWLLRFTDDASYQAFCDRFAQHMWESLNGLSWSKAKADEQRFVRQSHEDVEMVIVEEEDEEESEDEEEEEEQGASDSEDEVTRTIRAGEEQTDSDEPRPPRDANPNSQLAIGYKNDRSFVVRGNSIGVFSQTDDDEVKFVANIKSLATPGGKAFAPKKVMLHNQDSSMVMMDPSNAHALYHLDLETGKVVDEWRLTEGVSVNNITPDAKYAQMTPAQTFVGTSHNALFRVDPRLGGRDKLVDSQFKQYQAKNDFSAVTTTGAGKVAVASNKGDIRLFDTIGKFAKTALPALGDPILGIDVTADGKWVIATCKTYLLLINTEIGSGRYAGSSGFDRSFPADAKPIPRRLTLKPEHVAYMDQEVSFTPARFNVGENESETTIVTSTGPYVITFNFRRVKQGRLDDYKIRNYGDKVVADQFRFDNDRKIVAVLPNNVLQVDRKQLAKPSRQSLLSTPTKNLRSRSSIVDSPY